MFNICFLHADPLLLICRLYDLVELQKHVIFAANTKLAVTLPAAQMELVCVARPYLNDAPWTLTAIDARSHHPYVNR